MNSEFGMRNSELRVRAGNHTREAFGYLHRVAARPYSRRDPCKEKTHPAIAEWVSKGPNGPSRESRGQRPLVGARGNAPGQLPR